MKKTLILLFVVSIILSCKHSTSTEENPEWIHNLIAKYESEPVGNPPQSIWQYEYQGQTVYYVPPQCCDQYGTLYDVNGDIICAPDGGLTGRGDGRCPDFFQERKKEKLIWKDTRNP
jgi:hypothetical protein